MNKKILIGSIIAVFILIGVSFTSVVGYINAESDVAQSGKYVNIITEIFDISEDKSYNYKISRVRLDTLENVFIQWRQQLSCTASRTEVNHIHNHSIHDLFELGIFPREINLKDVQSVCTYHENLSPFFNRNNNAEENLNCLIIGKTNHTWFVEWRNPSSIIWRIIFHIGNLLISVLKGPLEPLVEPLLLMLALLYKRIPLKRDVDIAYGTDYYAPMGEGWLLSPASGWVWTKSDNGIVKWDGTYYGQLGEQDVFLFTHSYAGAINFSGVRIKILHPFFGFPSYYFGYAKHVCLDSTIPKP
jgi:hypothetical protein